MKSIPFFMFQTRLYRSLFFAFVFANVLMCSPAEEKIIQRLEERVESGDYSSSIHDEINTLLNKKFASNEKLLVKSPVDPILTQTLEGNMAVFSDGSTIHLLSNEDDVTIHLPEVPIAINPSFSGRYGIALLPHEKGCTLVMYGLKEKKVIHTLNGVSCRSTPAVDDAGITLYYVNLAEKLIKQDLRADQGSHPRPIALATNLFPAKYPKIQSNFHVYDLSISQMALFVGAGGFYRLFTLDVRSDKSRLAGEDFSRPVMYGGVRHSPLEVKRENTNEPASVSPLYATIYQGGAGGYLLRLVQLLPTFALSKTVSTATMNGGVYVSDAKELYTQAESSILIVKDSDRSTSSLPITVKNFALYHEGLVYINENGELKFRKTPLSFYEQRLMELRKKIDIQKRKDESSR